MKRVRSILGFQREGGQWSPTSHHRGRPSSWIAVTVLVAGMVVAGAALTQGPAWTALGVGGAILIAGGIFALAVDLMGDVVLDKPRLLPESPHPSRSGDPGVDALREREDETPPGRHRPASGGREGVG
jgi:hypothetical protein